MGLFAFSLLHALPNAFLTKTSRPAESSNSGITENYETEVNGNTPYKWEATFLLHDITYLEYEKLLPGLVRCSGHPRRRRRDETCTPTKASSPPPPTRLEPHAGRTLSAIPEQKKTKQYIYQYVTSCMPRDSRGSAYSIFPFYVHR